MFKIVGNKISQIITVYNELIKHKIRKNKEFRNCLKDVGM